MRLIANLNCQSYFAVAVVVVVAAAVVALVVEAVDHDLVEGRGPRLWVFGLSVMLNLLMGAVTQARNASIQWVQCL
mgnify:CR=1 FL=1